MHRCLLLVLLAACDTNVDEPIVYEPGEVVPDTLDGFASRFVNLDSADVVSCTLSDGSVTSCYSLTFSDQNPSDDGPYCPATIDDVGGVGVYDGPTNTGFQLMARPLFEAMEKDGYDIVDDQGNIRVIDGTSGGPPETGKAYCMALPKVSLTLTYLVPAQPVVADAVHELQTVEQVGVQLDGVPLTADPPSVVDGPPMPNAVGGNIPSIDPCGGHPDPAGYYHAHFVAESMNSVLNAHGIDQVRCTRVPQAAAKLVGFAKDGYPIYSAPADGLPAGVDECNGMTGVTSDFPQGTYHYFASATEAPNMPRCLKGAFVQQGAMTYE